MPRARVKAGTSKAAAAERRKAFAREYIRNGRNGTQAAITVGFSPRTAREQAVRILADVRTREMLDEMTAKAEAIADMDAEEAIRATTRVARFDIRKLFDPETGEPRPIHELDAETALAISHMGAHGLVPNDRLRALDMTYKRLGLYEKDNAQRGESLSVSVKLL